MTLRHGHFLDALAQRESNDNYDYLNPKNGAAGRYSILRGKWDEWSHAIFGTPLGSPRPIGVAVNQEIVAGAVITDYYRDLRAKTLAQNTLEPTLITWQRTAVQWRNGSGGGKDRALWTSGTKFYLFKLGQILARRGLDSWITTAQLFLTDAQASAAIKARPDLTLEAALALVAP